MKNKALFTAAVMVLLSLFIKDMPAQSVVVGGTNLNIGSGNLLTSDGNQGVCGNAVGNNDTIGIYSHGSIALGVGNNITGVASMAFGCAVKLAGNYGIGIGHHVRVTGTSGCMVIGNGIIGPGTDNNAYLVNANNNSLAVGFKSTKPTLFVSESPNNYSQGILDRTGRVAIGDVTPQAKLHIRSDVGEDAGVILVPADPTDNATFIQLHDDRHRITVNSSGEMSVSAGSSNAMGITSSNLNVEGGVMRIGSYFNNLHLSAEGTPSLSFNACPFEGDYYNYTTGPSYAVEFGDTGIRLRTAVNNTLPRDRNLIETWNDALTLKTNGAITLNGKVGVNTENTYTGYALAVDGGMITTKVHIQDVNDWQDRVFRSDYPMMPLDELEAYVAANRHLPGIPSEAEVKAQGYDLAGMQAALLGKVEELVLHTIRQQKEIDSLRTLVAVHFGYDACGNRMSRTLEFSRMEDPAAGSGEGTQHKETPWQASLTDRFGGLETSLFPNPTDGGFILSIGGEAPQGTTAALCTMDGKVIEERAVNDVTEEFDLSGKPAGVYLLRLSSSRETKAWKVVKRN